MNDISLLERFLKSKGVCTDSRTIEPDQIFFAIRGEVFDGNKFAMTALDNGALLAVVDMDAHLKADERIIRVESPLRVLQDLALAYRKYLKVPIIAITGTNGKTTTKELLFHILKTKYKAQATVGNLNNLIGLPLTLLSFQTDIELGITEYGASFIDDIEKLCKIGRPDYGLITNIGTAHMEGFGSQTNIVKAKVALYEYLSESKGTVFNNRDSYDFSTYLNRSNADVLSYSATAMHGKSIGEIERVEESKLLRFILKTTSGDSYPCSTQIFGDYNFQNIVNAIKIADFFEVEPPDICKSLETFKPNNNRSEIREVGTNRFFLDAYNANPSSMKAALDHFIHYKTNKKKKIVILGDMLEMGPGSKAFHQEVVKRVCREQGLLSVFVGKEFDAARDSCSSIHALFFENIDQTKMWFAREKIENSAILLKGSRGIGLEKLVE